MRRDADRADGDGRLLRHRRRHRADPTNYTAVSRLPQSTGFARLRCQHRHATPNRRDQSLGPADAHRAGVAQGVRREVETLFRTQAERWLRDLDLVKREEFEAVKEMARIAREDSEALKARVAALEAALAKADAATAPASGPGDPFRVSCRMSRPRLPIRAPSSSAIALPSLFLVFFDPRRYKRRGRALLQHPWRLAR